MQEPVVDLVGYRAADPAPIGTNPGAEPDVVQTVNVPRQVGHRLGRARGRRRREGAAGAAAIRPARRRVFFLRMYNESMFFLRMCTDLGPHTRENNKTQATVTSDQGRVGG